MDIPKNHFRIDHETSLTGKGTSELAHGRWCDSESERSWDENDEDRDSEENSDAETDAEMY